MHSFFSTPFPTRKLTTLLSRVSPRPRDLRLWCVVLAAAVAGCGASKAFEGKRFACDVKADCIEGFQCLDGECKPTADAGN
jgi:hypothetical protein